MGILTETLKEVEQLFNECRERCLAVIADSKQGNPDINVICKSPRMYTIKFSDMSSTSLSPRYYDYEWQYTFILDTLKGQSLEKMGKTVQDIIDTGKCKNEKIHPAVIEVLKQII